MLGAIFVLEIQPIEHLKADADKHKTGSQVPKKVGEKNGFWQSTAEKSMKFPTPNVRKLSKIKAFSFCGCSKSRQLTA